MLLPSVAADSSFGFIARENANSRGCFTRSAIAVSPKGIYFLSENADGIYRVPGNGNPQNITSGSMDNLFFRNGKAPEQIDLPDSLVVFPPDFSKPEQLRLFSIKDYVIFKFRDTNNKDRMIVFDEKIDNWISYDHYLQNQTNVIYREEDESEEVVLVGYEGKIGKLGGVDDIEQDGVQSHVIPFAYDGGDSRLQKLFSELVVSAISGDGLVATNFFNNGDIAAPFFFMQPSTVRKQYILNINDGLGLEAQNITTAYRWFINAGVKLFEQLTYFIPKGEVIGDRSGDVVDGGNIGAKLWQGVIIRANTFGEDKELQYFDDKNNLVATIVINHNGERTASYSFPNPFISHTIRRVSIDDTSWEPLVEQYIFDIEPEAAMVWEGEFNTSDLTGLILVKRIALAYRSNANATISFFFDDGTIDAYTIPNSNDNWKKFFFYLRPKKWLACKYRIETQTGYIRPYKRACEVWAKSINSQSDFIRMTPFGGDSNITDIKV